MLFSTCPCCSHPLLRHIRSRRVYWFCSHCHQEMPHYESLLENSGVPRNSSYYRGLNKADSALLF